MKNSNFKFQISSFFLLASFTGLLTCLYGCQLPILAPKGAFINKTNPDFLKDAGVDEKTNPHKDTKCEVCHKASRGLLTKENPSADEIMRRRLMRTDLVDLCARCHKATMGEEHSVGMTTKINKENLPLDNEGKLTCATTCHDVHATDPPLAKQMLRKPYDTMCLSCHEM